MKHHHCMYHISYVNMKICAHHVYIYIRIYIHLIHILIYWYIMCIYIYHGKYVYIIYHDIYIYMYYIIYIYIYYNDIYIYIYYNIYIYICILYYIYIIHIYIYYIYIPVIYMYICTYIPNNLHDLTTEWPQHWARPPSPVRRRGGIEFLVSVVVRADNVVGCPVSSWGTLGTLGWRYFLWFGNLIMTSHDLPI